MPSTPHVAVITVVFNGADTIGRTLHSVASQSWKPIEHVVIDGGSTDGTLDLIRTQGHDVRSISEPDDGLYDAMNKGVRLVTDAETYVVFLNADDEFVDEQAVERIMQAGQGEDLLYGRLQRYDFELEHRDVIGREATARDMLYGMRCHHQAMFCKRGVFDTVGVFDLRYRIAADYDWTVRLFLDERVRRRFVPEVVSVMRRGGVSDARYLDSVRERHDIVQRHYGTTDAMRYRAYSWFGDYLRYWTQQMLKRMGLLNAARGVKKLFKGGEAGSQ